MALSLSDLKKSNLSQAAGKPTDLPNKRNITKPWQDAPISVAETLAKPGENLVKTEGKPGDTILPEINFSDLSPLNQNILQDKQSLNIPGENKVKTRGIPGEYEVDKLTIDNRATITTATNLQKDQNVVEVLVNQDLKTRPTLKGRSSKPSPNGGSAKRSSPFSEPGEYRVKTEGKPGEHGLNNKVKTRLEPGDYVPPSLDSKIETRLKPGNKPGINSVRTEGKPGNQIRDFRTVVGHDRTVMLALFRIAQMNGSRATSFFSRRSLCQDFSLKYETLRSSLKRLKTFGILESVHSAPGGPGAWVQVTFLEEIYRSLMNNYPPTGLQPGENWRKTEGKLSDQPGDLAPSSSSIFNTYKTTTDEASPNNPPQLPDEWLEVDFSCLASERFTENHLLQIYQSGKVSAEVAQESILELHHDLTVNKNKSLRNPRNVLLSLLKKGTPYTSPGYEPEYLKVERKCLEEQKRRQGELIQIQQEQERLKALPAETLKEEDFQEWLSQLTLEQKRQIAPMARNDGSEMQTALLRAHWEAYILNQYTGTESGESNEWIRQQIDKSIGFTKSEVEKQTVGDQKV